jgi:uncharacterized membrane protein YphA (DoxX/SURF4 family)
MGGAKPRKWTLAERIGFRFLFAYLLLFFFPFPSGLVNPAWLGGLFDNFWERVVPWFSNTFLHIGVAHVNNGSGDTTYDYLRILCMVLLAIMATVIWSILDRRRDNYRTLHSWARIWLRYALALCMLTFGAVKILMIQFESPGYGRLIQPLGQLSPMALLWVFMGFSKSYTCFTGVMEVIGGLLLFFRRTTTLGALMVAGAMANVLMLNMSYDVPVKLGSLHILGLALVLLAPDMRRLLDFFVLNRPTTSASLGPRLASRSLNRGSMAIKILVICALLTYLSWDAYKTHRKHLATILSNPTAPEGWYRIVSIRKDGKEVPALTLNEFRWKTFSLRGSLIGLRAVDGSLHRFKAEGDPIQGPVDLYPVNDKYERIMDSPSVGSLRLNVAEHGQASVKGIFEGHDFEAAMQRENPADFPLMSRGFHWISESPYFR